MRLTVLGSAGSYPAPGRACSSYLLEAGGHRVLLDCGNGAMTNLLREHDVHDVDALVLTHRHHDHLADAYALHTALQFHPAGPRPLRLYAQRDTWGYLGTIAGGVDRLRPLLDLHAVEPDDVVETGPVRLSFRSTAHPVPTLAVRAEHDGTVIAYSADSGPCDALVETARGADLFLCEATWAGSADGKPRDLHCTGTQAGELAKRAGARRLLVTHVAHPMDPQRVAVEAGAAFGAEVEAAADLATYDV